MLLKLGEIVLKGRNRQQFERLLHTNIRGAVRDMEFAVQLWQREGVILLRVEGAADPEAAADALAERMRDIPGIVRVCRVLRVAKAPDAAADAAVELTAGQAGLVRRARPAAGQAVHACGRRSSPPTSARASSRRTATRST